MSEVLASITKLEYAYTKAPQNMKSTIQAIALSPSLSPPPRPGIVSLSEDPLLVLELRLCRSHRYVWCIGFYLTFRKADSEEDAMNNLKRVHIWDLPGK